MDSLISRQAALDCFHDWIDQHGDIHTPDEMPEYRAIEALPSAQPMRWIPVTERLPEDRVDVLICYRFWQNYAKRYVYAIVNGWHAHKYSVKENVFSEWEADCDYKEDEDEYYISEGWYEFTTQGNSDLMNWYIGGGAEVVAWMPLPEPWKGDTE